MALDVGRVEASAVLNDAKFYVDLKRLKEALRDLDGQDLNIDANLDAGKTKAQLAKLKSDLGKADAKIEVDADTKAAKAILADLKRDARLLTTELSSKKQYGLDADAARRKLAQFRAEAAVIERELNVDIDDSDVDKTLAKLALLETTLRTAEQRVPVGRDSDVLARSIAQQVSLDAARARAIASSKEADREESAASRERLRQEKERAAVVTSANRLIAAQQKEAANDEKRRLKELEVIKAAAAKEAERRQSSLDRQRKQAAAEQIAAVKAEAAARKNALGDVDKELARRRQLIALAERMARFNNNGDLDIDTAEAIAKAKLELDIFEKDRLNIPVDIELSAAQIAAFRAQLEAIDEFKVEAKIDVDRSALSRLGGLFRSGGDAGGITDLLRVQQGLGPLALSGSASGVAAAGPLLVPAAVIASVAALAAGFAAITVGAATAGVAVTKFALDAADDLELPLRGLARVTGDSFEQIGADVIDFAARTPFSVSTAITAAQKIIASGTAPGEAVDQLSLITDAVSFSGGTEQNINSLILALTQGRARGKLQQRVLTSLTRNAPGAIKQDEVFKNIAEELNVAANEVPSLLSKGLIDFDVGLRAVNATIRETPGVLGASEDGLNTLSGALSNLQDNLTASAFVGFGGFIDNLRKEINEGGISDALSGGLLRIGAAVTTQFDSIAPKLAPAIQGIGKFIASAIDAVGPAVGSLIQTIGRVSTALAPTLVPAFEGVAGAIERAEGPLITLGTLGAYSMQLIIAGGRLLIASFDTIRGAAYTVQSALLGAFAAIGKSIVGVAQGAVDSFIGVAENAGRFLKVTTGVDPFKQFIGGAKDFRDTLDTLDGRFDGIADDATTAGDKAKEAFGGAGNQIAAIADGIKGIAFGSALGIIDLEFGYNVINPITPEDLKERLTGIKGTLGIQLEAQLGEGFMSEDALGQVEEITQASYKIAKGFEVAGDQASVTSTAFASAFDAVSGGSEDAKVEFGSFIDSVISDLDDLIFQQNLVRLLFAGGFDNLAGQVKGLSPEDFGKLDTGSIPTDQAALGQLEADLEVKVTGLEDAKSEVVEYAANEISREASAALIVTPTFNALGMQAGIDDLDIELADLERRREILIETKASPSSIEAVDSEIARLTEERNAQITFSAALAGDEIAVVDQQIEQLTNAREVLIAAHAPADQINEVTAKLDDLAKKREALIAVKETGLGPIRSAAAAIISAIQSGAVFNVSTGGAIASLNRVAARAASVAASVSRVAGGAVARSVTGRHMGGVDPAGTLLKVGEKGPEYLSFNTSTSVLNNQTTEKIDRLLGLSASGGNYTTTVNTIAAAANTTSGQGSQAPFITDRQVRNLANQIGRKIGPAGNVIVQPQTDDPAAIVSMIQSTMNLRTLETAPA